MRRNSFADGDRFAEQFADIYVYADRNVYSCNNGNSDSDADGIAELRGCR